AALVIGLTQHGGLQRALGAVDELAAEALLELVDEPANGRLRKLVRLRRLGEAAQFDQIAEHLDRLQLHRSSPVAPGDDTICSANTKRKVLKKTESIGQRDGGKTYTKASDCGSRHRDPQ